MTIFSYEQAFSRNLGWVSEAEQQSLRGKRVAIAGMGGVGGVHLLTLARLGVGAFSIADFDTFDIVNFNRQAGAAMSTLGQPKVDVMARMALDINPDLDIRRFPQGIDGGNLDSFFADADLYVDARVFSPSPARGPPLPPGARGAVPAIPAAPLGRGRA